MSENEATDLKCKISTKACTTSLSEKILTMHSYTPKQYKIHTAMSSSRINTLPSNKTPIKRYFSDNVLSQATPDCFNVVQVETPSSKSNEIDIEDQTVYEEENTNLTVGIRVRPLNTK